MVEQCRFIASLRETSQAYPVLPFPIEAREGAETTNGNRELTELYRGLQAIAGRIAATNSKFQIGQLT